MVLSGYGTDGFINHRCIIHPSYGKRDIEVMLKIPQILRTQSLRNNAKMNFFGEILGGEERG